MDRQQLMVALRRASNAGDAYSARRFARMIDKLETESPYASVVDDMSIPEKLLVGVGRGMTNVGRGIQDLTYRATGNEDALDKLNKRIESEENTWNYLSENSTAANVGEIGGEILATLPVGLGVGSGAKALLKTAQTGSKLVKGSIAAGAAGVDAGVSAGLIQRGGLDERLDAAGTAAATGAVLSPVMEKAGGLVRKGLNKGKYFTSEKAARADELADEFGVDVHLEDALESPTLSKISGVMNDVPLVGTGKGKIKQNKQVQEATHRYIEDLTGSDDLGQINDGLRSTINDIFKDVRKQKNKLYDDYHNALSVFGNVERTNTKEVAERLLKEAQEAGSLDGDYSSLLKKVLDTPEGSAKALRDSMSELSERIEAGFSGRKLGTAKSTALGQLKEAMQLDVDNFAKQIEKSVDNDVQVLSKLRDANELYKTKYAPFKENRVLNAALKNDEPEAILRELNKLNGSGVRTQQVYSSLNREGQKRMQAAFLLDAYNKSFVDNTFSPKTFKTKIENLSRVHKVLFQGEDQKVFRGIVDLMEYAKNSAEASANPKNGSRLVTASLIGGSAGATLGLGLPAAIATAGKVGSVVFLFKLMTQTKTSRQLLTASSGRTAGTKSFDFILDYLGTAARKAAALEASISD